MLKKERLGYVGRQERLGSGSVLVKLSFPEFNHDGECSAASHRLGLDQWPMVFRGSKKAGVDWSDPIGRTASSKFCVALSEYSCHINPSFIYRSRNNSKLVNLTSIKLSTFRIRIKNKENSKTPKDHLRPVTKIKYHNTYNKLYKM